MTEKPESGKKEVLVILGKRGSGKSTLAQDLVKDKSRLLIYDSTGHDYDEGVIITHYAELLDYLIGQERKAFRVTYKPLHAERDFDAVCEVVKRLGRLTFLVDECDLYATPSFTPENFLWILKLGRHRDIEVVCVSRRPAEMSRNVTAQAEQFFVFKTTEPRDIMYLKGFIDGAEKIKTLDIYSFLWYNKGDEKICAKVGASCAPAKKEMPVNSGLTARTV